MPTDKQKFWFPAKQYGWGWGPPVVWQGWAVLIGWIAAVIGVSPWLARRNFVAYIVFMVVMTLLLIVVCWMKGERARWRWGEKTGEDAK